VNLYIVQNGRVGRCQRDERGLVVEGIKDVNLWWREPGLYETDLACCFALADDRADALALARAYDRGDLFPAETLWQGIVVVALARPPDAAVDEPAPGAAAIIILASAVAGLIIAATIAWAACIAMH
jgi:hypothetical protein